MRRLISLLLLCCLLLPAPWAMAEPAALSVQPVSETIRPGRSVLLGFTVPEQGEIDLCLEDEKGNELSVIVLGYEVEPGLNQVYWNGTYGGYPAPEGRYQLVLTMNGSRASVPVTVGSQAPYLNNMQVENRLITPEQPLRVSFYAGAAGRITTGVRRGSEWYQLASWAVSEGDNRLEWAADPDMIDGEMIFTIQLSDSEGGVSTEEHLVLTLEGFRQPEPEPTPTPEPTAAPEGDVSVEEIHYAQDEIVLDQTIFTPSYGSPYTGKDTTLNYWTLPMDITDEAAVWEMLMQPVTVLDNGKKNAERTQEIIYREPSKSSKGIGVVTCMTQSVHVLERGDEWTLIETYSSSFHDSAVKNWNALVQGYVPTKFLKTVKPDSSMGMVVDKLTQRLYIFREGKLYDTLLVSTGLANERQPYNETRSGEFLLQNPAVGTFASDNMRCAMGIRFNSGDLLHEVPHILMKDGGRSYTTTEPKLGTRGSHGCIRVQRLRTPKGTSMTWLWNNRKDEMKIVIWEDWQGRRYPYPSDDTILYVNPGKGSMYHSS